MKEVARTGGGRALLLEALRIVGATIGQTLVHDGTDFVPADAPSSGIPEPVSPDDGDVLFRAGGAWTAVPGVGVLGNALAAALTVNGEMIVRAGGVVATLLSGTTGRAVLGAATKADARAELDVYSVDKVNTLVTGVTYTPATVTTTHAAAEGDVLLCDATAAGFTVTLPPAAGVARSISIKKTDASAHVVTVDGDGAELIDGAATLALTTQYEAVTLWSDGAAWWVF